MKNLIPSLNKPLYFRIIQDDFNMDLSTSVVGYEKCSKGKPTIELKKSLFIIHYVLDGKGYIRYKSSNELFECGKGSCFLIPPGETVEYYQDKDDPRTYFWFEFSGSLGHSMIEKIDFKSHKNILQISNDSAIRKIINKLFNEESYKLSAQSETLRVQSLIYSFFSVIINEYHKEEVQLRVHTTEEQVKVILRYINNNYTSPDLTVQKIADEFFFHPSYLTRIFKEYNGISPMKYIIVLRMRQAIEMLKTKSYSVLQIAAALGYKNQFYFSKEFKKFYGVPPTEYFNKNSGVELN